MARTIICSEPLNENSSCSPDYTIRFQHRAKWHEARRVCSYFSAGCRRQEPITRIAPTERETTPPCYAVNNCLYPICFVTIRYFVTKKLSNITESSYPITVIITKDYDRGSLRFIKHESLRLIKQKPNKEAQHCGLHNNYNLFFESHWKPTLFQSEAKKSHISRQYNSWQMKQLRTSIRPRYYAFKF